MRTVEKSLTVLRLFLQRILLVTWDASRPAQPRAQVIYLSEVPLTSYKVLIESLLKHVGNEDAVSGGFCIAVSGDVDSLSMSSINNSCLEEFAQFDRLQPVCLILRKWLNQYSLRYLIHTCVEKVPF